MDIKQVIVMRKDLNMRKGKMVVQGSHASMKVFFDMIVSHRKTCNDSFTFETLLPPGEIGKDMLSWVGGIFKKVCCGVNSEEELLAIYNQAKEKGLPCALIQDAGLTEFGGVPTYTCCAIGPAKSELIDVITGNLTLL